MTDATKPVLEINLDLLAKHFRVFRTPDKPVSIGTSRCLQKYLEQRYPGHSVSRDSINKFMASWVNQKAYLNAVRISREKSPDGKTVRHTLFGGVVDTKKYLSKAKQEALSKNSELDRKWSKAVFDKNDLSARGLPILKLEKPT